ncbi:MAG: SPOR domain-containing protein [Pseudorhodoplanes sp.]|nr:SPOR domain-containing protein [Pseudorhodoplanes sp.]
MAAPAHTTLAVRTVDLPPPAPRPGPARRPHRADAATRAGRRNPAPATQTYAVATAPATAPAPSAAAPSTRAKPRTGWIIQVGAFEAESEARERLSSVQEKASKLLAGSEPFTEPVSKGNKTLYRARFAGLKPDQAEAACRILKRSDIACMALRN